MRIRARFVQRLVAAVCVGVPLLAAVPKAQQAPQQTPATAVVQDAILSDAHNAYDATDYEKARGLLDPIIAGLSGTSRAEQRATLVAAYELRGRTRFNLGDLEGARTDFRAMLLLDPTYLLSAQVAPRVLALFEEVKKTTVGIVAVVVTPADALVSLDDVRLSNDKTGISLIGGNHTVSATRTGYAPTRQSFTVIPGAGPQTVTLDLERLSSSLVLLTSPANVEVVVDGVSHGRTELDPEAKSADGGLVSKRFVVSDLQTGRHRIELRRDCYIGSERQLDVPKADDYNLDTVKLTPAIATVTVESSVPGATVFVDDAPRGAVPLVMTDVCEGPHTVEVRSRFGRHLRRMDIKPGQPEVMQARVRPAFAIVSDSGAAGAVRGGPDLRLAAEAALQDATTVTLFAPSEKRAADLLTAEKLPVDWLAFDVLHRPMGGAATIGESARRELATKLARALDAQGIAAVARDPDGGQADMLLILLAPGSAEPDVIRWRLSDLQSLRETVRRLDQVPPLFHSSIGVLPIDVVDVDSAVVAAVEPGSSADGAGIRPGDLITTASGGLVNSALQLQLAVNAVRAGQPLPLVVRDAAGATKSIDVRVEAVPNVVSLADVDLPSNKLALDYAYRASALSNALEEAAVRLNMAAVSMRLRNWSDATRELEHVVKVAGEGGVPPALVDTISGTAQFMLGLAAEATGDMASAERAWRTALQSRGNLLTSTGEPIKDMAEQRLSQRAANVRP